MDLSASLLLQQCPHCLSTCSELIHSLLFLSFVGLVSYIVPLIPSDPWDTHSSCVSTFRLPRLRRAWWGHGSFLYEVLYLTLCFDGFLGYHLTSFSLRCTKDQLSEHAVQLEPACFIPFIAAFCCWISLYWLAPEYPELVGTYWP